MADLSQRVVDFLSAGTRTAMLGYVAADGRPLVAPVWFVVDMEQDGGHLVFTTGRDTSKGRALKRDPRVVICVDDPHPPYSFVQVQGVAAWSEDPDEVLEFATRTGARYMGADRAEEFGRRNAVPGELVVRVRPIKVNAGFDIAN
ncbi:PPOX class F420-dependent oxidoreductase [Mycobacterium palustre]|uniref:F420-dependent protein n=1 Tax=Mycobacterium palustre TaxID=153971 RepID=A0A1X1ZQC7_9MYCO|nr:PPOX class F420-dependent oxidoreductase [Mycobacterium palustre]MCV7103546.1 PPOX class F420-dependent oxidoreductase [Mycobacterium palustre]ORW25515.1 F420-dependent protein [Mycobacterium palustre]